MKTKNRVNRRLTKSQLSYLRSTRGKISRIATQLEKNDDGDDWYNQMIGSLDCILGDIDHMFYTEEEEIKIDEEEDDD